jgi:hypothetical protein
MKTNPAKKLSETFRRKKMTILRKESHLTSKEYDMHRTHCFKTYTDQLLTIHFFLHRGQSSEDPSSVHFKIQ